MQLIKYDAACRALAEAKAVDEAKDISDRAGALQAYAKQANNPELERAAAEIRLRAKRRIGEISATIEKAAGRPNSSQPREELSKAEELKNAGISTSEAHRCEKLAEVPEKEFLEYIEKCRSAGAVVSSDQIAKRVSQSVNREEKIARITEKTRSLPDGELFNVLYVDPPWRYEHVKTESRAIENQYPTMALGDICDLAVPAADDAVLFIWATAPKLEEAMQVINAWGFIYRTCSVWDKEKIGMGYYFRQQHELLLVATCGDLPAPQETVRESSVHREKRGKHSSKPEYYAQLIERLYPEYPRIELFARSPREGWAVWGNEANAA